MKLEILEKFDPPYDDEWQYLFLKVGPFVINWFTDCGDWFIYVYLGKRYWRFSSAGFLSGQL